MKTIGQHAAGALGNNGGFVSAILEGDYDQFAERLKRIAKANVQSGNWTREEGVQFLGMIPSIWDKTQAQDPCTIPAREYQCQECLDQGVVETDLGSMVCPNPECVAAQANTTRLYTYWKDRIAHLGTVGYYQRLTFDNWDRMERWKKDHKRFPYMAARLFVTAKLHYTALHDIFQAAKLSIPEGLPNTRRNSLVFYGDLGVGKTGLAASIMWELNARKIPVLMVRTWDMLSSIKEKYFKQNKTETAQDVAQVYMRIPVLILDEWNIEKRTETDIQRMQELIRYRHGERLPTIITTNLHPDEFYGHWGGRTADVLMEMAHVMEIGGAKIREDAPVIGE